MFNLVKVSCLANQAGSSWADTNIQQLVLAGIVLVLAILFMAAKSERQKAAGVCLLFSGVMAGSLPIINLNIDFACGDHLTTAHLTEALPYLNGFVLLMLVTCGVGAIASALKYFKLVRTELNTVRVDILPALSLRLPLARKGWGFLQLDAHVRARECS